MQKTSRQGSRGFTLIEVLMAMLVMTVGLLGLLQSVNVAYEHNLRNKLREEAVLVAHEQMNGLRAGVAFNPTTTVVRGIGGVDRKYFVNRVPKLIGGDSSRLTVAVRWSFKNLTTTHEIYTFRRM